jgi:hypothetical protein
MKIVLASESPFRAFENDAVLLFADRIAGSSNLGTALPPSRLIVLLREQGIEV